jgi:hypothetical protein
LFVFLDIPLIGACLADDLPAVKIRFTTLLTTITRKGEEIDDH